MQAQGCGAACLRDSRELWAEFYDAMRVVRFSFGSGHLPGELQRLGPAGSLGGHASFQNRERRSHFGRAHGRM